MLSREDRIELQRLRCDHAALCFQVALIKYGLQLRYDDNQPRVPAGHVGAGRWTSDAAHEASRAAREDAQRRDAEPPASPPPQQDEWRITHVNHRPDGSIERQIVVTPDGDTISSVFARPGEQRFDERHRVQLADGTVRIFETTQGVQKIYDGDGALLSATRWTDKGPEAVETVELARMGTRALPKKVGLDTAIAALSVYNVLTAIQAAGQRTILSFPARLYERDVERGEAIFVGRLDRTEVKAVCEKVDKVQDITDRAASSTDRDLFVGAAAYGTAVHKKVERAINEGPNKDPKLEAEVSLLKTLEETGSRPSAESRLKLYGAKGSIRVDVLEYVSGDLVCVYDIKTGTRGLTHARYKEIAQTIYENYGLVKRFVITETRPQR